MKRIYFDTCCLNRPFDDQRQARIRLEAEAMAHLLRAVEEHSLVWISSDVLLYEVHRCPDAERRNNLLMLCRLAAETVSLDDKLEQRAKQLRGQGMRDLDALHLASAEAGQVDAMLTTDDRLMAAAARLSPPSSVRVANPVTYETEMLS
jgi:predicted nucleic acid-binding protein